MHIALIAAVAKNGVIGYRGAIPWDIKRDRLHFKELTMGKPVVMGRKTAESILKRNSGVLLPGRTVIVMSKSGWKHDGVISARCIHEALDAAKRALKGKRGKNCTLFVAGGREVYEEAFPYASSLYLTRIDQVFPGDVFFPSFDEKEWVRTCREDHYIAPDSPYPYSFETHVRTAKPKKY